MWLVSMSLDVPSMNLYFTFLIVLIFVAVRFIDKNTSFPIKFIAYGFLAIFIYLDLSGVNSSNKVTSIVTIGICCIEGFDNLIEWIKSHGSGHST